MEYDNIKRLLGESFNRKPFYRKLFYRLLDALLLRSWHIRRELRRLRHQLPTDAAILDAGAGFGQYTWFMARLGRSWRIKAVDVKEEQVAACNRFFEQTGLSEGVRFETADLTRFCEPERYHLALSVDVMEHIEDDETVFANICQSLCRGGVLLLSTPSDRGGSDADEHHGSFVSEHVRDGYNADEIAAKLRKAGFTTVATAYTYGFAGHLSWVLSMKWPMKMLHCSRVFLALLPFYYLIAYPWCIVFNLFDVVCKPKTGTGLLVKATKAC